MLEPFGLTAVADEPLHAAATSSWRASAVVCVMSAVAVTQCAARELDDHVSIGGVVAAAGQCQELGVGSPGSDSCRGEIVVQPELSYRPRKGHELLARLGFATGDGLDLVPPFNLATWAADLEDSVKNVNGSRWKYLLTAWYRFTANRPAGDAVDVTVGIIDGTDFLDTNAYSNDEYSQFMHAALVNGPNVFMPSYAPGFAARWRDNRLSVTGVYMRVGQAAGDSFDFYAVETGYHAETRLGNGNYRLLLDTTSESFPNPTGARLERRTAVLLSCDQELGGALGGFVRIGRQSDQSTVDYGALYSGGVEVAGVPWRRPGDTIGVGYAYLTGGTSTIRSSRVFETYYRAVIVGELAVTGDVQYVHDAVVNGDDASGWVFGLRATYVF